jgi:hypothetical protein
LLFILNKTLLGRYSFRADVPHFFMTFVEKVTNLYYVLR